MSPASIMFRYESQMFPMSTSEAAFQAHKVYAAQPSVSLEEKISWLYSLAQADGFESKKLGRQLAIDLDKWKELSYDYMVEVQREKFQVHSALAEKLVATGSLELIEDNNHGDTLWGRCNGIGKNQLGVILMQVRKELYEQAEEKSIGFVGHS